MDPYRIVSLDGGGIHGLLSAVLLKRIETERPGFLALADLFTGTSAGGIMALLLASSDNPADKLDACIDLWARGKVFSNSPIGYAACLTGQRPLYSNHNLIRFLTPLLGDLKLGDLRKKVAVPALQLDSGSRGGALRSWQPVLFQNLGVMDVDGGSDEGEKAIDCALRTSAPPAIFPAHQGYVDGGLFANNPSMMALSLALEYLCRPEHDHHHRHSVRGGLDDLLLLSVGTGSNRHYLSAPRENIGFSSWFFDPRHPFALLDACIESGEGVIEYECRRLLGGAQFYRLDPQLPRSVSRADAAHQIPMLIKTALAADISEVLIWLDNSHWFKAHVSVKGAGAAKAAREEAKAALASSTVEDAETASRKRTRRRQGATRSAAATPEGIEIPAI